VTSHFSTDSFKDDFQCCIALHIPESLRDTNYQNNIYFSVHVHFNSIEVSTEIGVHYQGKYNMLILGQEKKFEIQLSSGSVHFSFQLPPLKYHLPNYNRYAMVMLCPFASFTRHCLYSSMLEF